MKSITQSLIKQFLPTFAAISLCSCQVRSPLYVVPGFAPAEVNQVAVLQPVDLRADTSTKINLNKSVAEQAKYVLEMKGYKSAAGTTRPLAASEVRPQLAKPSPAWIASLPTNDRWALLLVLKNSKSEWGLFSREADAEVDAYLFDKTKKIVSWKDQGVGTAKAEGLLQGAMVANERNVVKWATSDAMITLPKVPGSRPPHMIDRLTIKD